MSSARKGLRRAGVGSLSALLAATAMTGLASTASATSNATFTRVAGADRYATSAETAKLFTAPTDLILASGEPGHTVDALAASYMAGLKKAPILLTHLNTTPASVMNEIKASGAKNIFIVGGTGAVSATQEQALKDAGYTVNRLSGADRWGTAADIINHGNKSATALIATGLDFPDALGGGSLAYAAGLPMAIVRKDSVPADVLAALKTAGVTQVIILGGEGVVSPAVVAQLAAEGITVKARLGGANRAETSTMLADYEIANYGFTNTQANIASGYAFGDGADALGGAAFSGEKKTPLLITKNATQADELAKWLSAHSNTVAGGTVFGGNGAVADALVASLQAAARTAPSTQVLVVSPGDAATVTDDGDTDATKTADNRAFTVTGLDNDTTYTVALVDSDLVATKDGKVSFLKADGTVQTGSIDATGTLNSQITVVNGNTIAVTNETSAKPVNGTLQFTVNGNGSESYTAVVYQDANSSGTLNLDNAGVPTESFGASGSTTVLPAEADQGVLAADADIEGLNKAGDSLIANDGVSSAVYNYDANDRFYLDSAADPANEITMAKFESLLTVGDDLVSGAVGTGTYYQPESGLSSTFVLSNTNPAAPDDPTFAPTDTSVTLTITSASIEKGATVNVYQAAAGDDFADATKVASSATDEDADTAQFQITATGLTADTSYEFYVTQTVDGEESAPNVDVATAGTTDVTTLKAIDSTQAVNSVTPDEVNNGTGDTTTIIVTFAKAVDDTADDPTGITVSPEGQPGLVFTSTAVTYDATKKVATVTLDGTLTDAATDITYNVTVDAGAMPTTVGPNDKLTGTFKY